VKKTTLLGILFAVAVLSYLVISSFHTQPFKCQVCITFKGNRDCRTGSGESRQAAIRTATTTACAQLSGGVTESNQCENTPPDSVDWLK
jgi:hypothetical protein